MKYKSDLIKEIVETRGHNLSSPHYESECVESWIEETIGAYPKLCDYESEWLNYINENHSGDSGDFSYETITVITEATVDNVVPHAYKRAILRGNTLVNIIKNPSEIKVVGKGGSTLAKYKVNYLDKTKNYTVLFKISEYVGSGNITVSLGTTSKGLTEEVNKNGIYKFLIPSDKIGSDMNEIWIYWTASNWTSGNSANVSDIMLIEGDYTNVDIPYFEGMKSVQMPVLTTSNEDGTETNILTVNEDVKLRGIGEVKDELNLLTGEMTERIGEIVLDGSENWSKQGVSQNNSNLGIYYSTKALPNTMFNTNNVLCDKFKASKNLAWHSSEEDIYISISNYGLKICFDERKLESKTVEGLKKWLSENTPTIQYPLVEKSIKTVALTPLNKPYKGTNHYHLTANILCEAILEVPVVSTGKQTIEEINN